MTCYTTQQPAGQQRKRYAAKLNSLAGRFKAWQAWRMKTARDIIAAFGGSAKFAEATGHRPGTVRLWKHRNSIPHEHFPSVVKAAREKRVRGVTLESLHALEVNA
jgi:hypothetical protein